MSDVKPHEYMPQDVSVARILMFVQAGFGLIGVVIAVVAVVGAIASGVFVTTELGLMLPVLIPGVLFVALNLLAALRFGTRRRWVRVLGLSLQGLSLALWVAGMFLEGDGNALNSLFNLVLPLIVLILLARPPAAHWFSR